MINLIKYVYILSYYLGVRWILFRIIYLVKIKSGILEKLFPVKSWKQCSLKKYLLDTSLAEVSSYAKYRNRQDSKFKIAIKQEDFSFLNSEAHSVIDDADQILKGVFPYFSRHRIKTGFPPKWHVNYITGQQFPVLCHWSKISDFGHGDIKLVWELGRFTFAYSLVRAYVRTGDERYPETFWNLFENWWENNPPNQGVHWKCGQEISFRVMACIFAYQHFKVSASTTPERMVKLAQMMVESGGRIYANINYALHQHNNHGMSEAVGLWTIGVFFSEFRHALKWRKKGMHILKKQADELIYSDGAFSQHSMNYHRLMLQDYLWVFSLADKLNIPVDLSLRNQILKAFHFLYQMHEPLTGAVPNYGANDGSLILPLNNCSYLDYRPVLQTMCYYFYRSLCFSFGPWNEDMLWLFGSQAMKAKYKSLPLHNVQAKEGGYYTFRASKSWAMLRCCKFNHRPGHADQLHIDLWWQGKDILIDAGTYSYHASPPWHDGLSSTHYHNTVFVDDKDQMEKFSRFLWMPWSIGMINKYQKTQYLSYIEGCHDGYQRLNSPVSHKRSILQLGDEHWIILDSLDSKNNHDYSLHYLLPDYSHVWNSKNKLLKLQLNRMEYNVQLGANLPSNVTLLRAGLHTADGWHSPCYYFRCPALSLTSHIRGKSVLFWTVLGPKFEKIKYDETIFLVKMTDFSVVVKFSGSYHSIVKNITITGKYNDYMEII